MRKKPLALFLALALALSLCACSSATVRITNAGMTLSVPAEYNDQLHIELDAGFDLYKMQFRVSEQLFAEADGESDGGLLFGIGRMTEDEFRECMCRDMSGARVFAVDEQKNYYLLYGTSDASYLRPEGGCTDEEWALLTELCEWAAGAPDRFMADNPGLTPCSRSNSDLDILLNRLLHWQNIPFTLTRSGTGKSLQPSSELSLPYLEQLTACLVSDADGIAAPEGEYITLQLPGEGAQVDFFLDGSGLFRISFSSWDGTSVLGRIDCGSTSSGKIVLDWYTAAENAQQ